MKSPLAVLVLSFTVAGATLWSAPAEETSETLVVAQEGTRALSAFTVHVEGEGPPVLLIPGLSCDGTVWDSTVEHLRDRYQCHVLSLAGFAGTPPIEGSFLSEVRGDIVTYVHDRHLQQPVLIGHSLGGTVAFQLAADNPELFGPVIAVDGVPFLPALMNPSATEESGVAFGSQMQAMLENGGRPFFEMQTRAAMTSMITDPATAKRFADLGVQSDPATVGRAVKDLMSTDLRPRIAAIKAPVLLIGEASSAKDPAAKERITAAYVSQVSALPAAKVLIAPDSRHFVMLDNPEWFHATVDEFLEEHGE